MQKTIPCTRCFSTLGVGSRMAIYNYLKENGKSTVSKIVSYIKLTQPTVSYHLKEMRESGLLVSERVGKEVRYSIDGICHDHGDSCVLSNLNLNKERK